MRAVRECGGGKAERDEGAAVVVCGWNWAAVGVARAEGEGKLTLGDRLVLERRHGRRGEAESRRCEEARSK